MRVARKPTPSVTADENGMRARSKRMFTTIERRDCTDVSEFRTVISTSWNGTIAQATLRPAASPGRSSTKAISSR